MALYWHPYLAELLKLDYGDRLDVKDEFSLGDMPLKADFLLIRRDPSVPLPFPFCFLGTETIVEYKSPDDTAAQEDLSQLEIYGMMYAQNKKMWRKDLTLWLVASHFHAEVSHPEGAYLSGKKKVGKGVLRGRMDKFPTFFVDLRELPFAPESLPLNLVAKGPREQELVEFLVDHYREYPKHVQFLRELHGQKLREVLRMRQLTPEQIGIDYQALLDLLGEERAIDLMGKERAIQLLAQRKDRERMLEEFIRLVGPETAHEVLKKVEKESTAPPRRRRKKQ
jgi:hypothetical protein